MRLLVTLFAKPLNTLILSFKRKPESSVETGLPPARERRYLGTGLVICMAVCCSPLLTGCQSVSAWERGNLAKEEMGINPTPNQNAFRDHIFNSKEASQGGHSGGGGGCGCN